MTHFVYYDNSGKILSVRSQQLKISTPFQTNIDTFLENEEAINPNEYYVYENQLIKIPNKPFSNYNFDYNTKQWLDPRTLEDIKSAKWSEIKQARDRAEFDGFTWDGSQFDSTPISQQRISGAVQLAMINPNYTVDWTLSNNTTRTLSAQDVIAVGISLGNHVNAQHEKARQLREQINNATTIEQVNAITW